MRKKKRQELPVVENIEIADTAAEGKAIARWNDRVVFVPYAAPGDVADIQLTKRKQRFYEGKIVRLRKKSEYRVEPVCSHFGLCGGCKWQHLDYTEQLKLKEKQVRDSLNRIAKVSYEEFFPIIGSEKQYEYRNKLEFTFTDRRWLTDFDPSKEEGGPENMNGLGFHLPGLFNRVLDVEHCYLQPEPSNKIRLAVKEFALKNGLSFYNLQNRTGLLRNLIIRNSTTGELMVIVVFSEDDKEKIYSLMEFLSRSFPEISSLIYVINGKSNDIISDLETIVYKGKGFLTEEMPAPVAGMPALKFEVGPVSFYQTNPPQAFRLYQTAFDFAEFKGDELVYDLYTGTGTIAAFVARWVKKVVGLEYVDEAIEDARKNLALNRIDNVEFYAGDLAKVLDEGFINQNGKPDVIITDPPRAGMHPKVVSQIMTAEPEKIVYVSCNPATQARDIALLGEKYEIKKVQPVDMFPQTHHVENVVLLKLKKEN